MTPPPLLPRLLVRLLVSRRHREAIEGDLHEEWHARAPSRLGFLLLALGSVFACWRASLRPLPAANRSDLVSSAIHDVRYAARVLRKSPAFLLTTVLTLAVGVALVTVAFTVFNAYFLKPYAIRSPETLHRLGWHSDGSSAQTFRWRDFEAIRERGDLFESVLAQDPQLVSSEGRPLVAALVSDNFFDALGPPLHLGRGLAPIDGVAEAPAVVLSHRAWTRLAGADRAAIGRELQVSGHRFTIVGVLAPEFVGLGDSPSDVWILLETYASLVMPELTGDRQPMTLEILGRLQPGVTIEQARAALAPVLAGTVPGQQNVRVLIEAEPTPIPLDAGALVMLMPVLAAFGLVLVTACANVSNVMLARAIARQREMAVRLSLGASRLRIIRQLLTEGLLLSLLSGVAGLALGHLVLRVALEAFYATLPASFDIIRLPPLTGDARVFAFACGVAAAAALAFSLLPAIQASRVSVTGALRGHGLTAPGASRLRSVLVVGQVTVSLVLVVTALTFARGGAALDALDPGYQTAGVTTVTPRGDKSILPKLAQVLAEDARVRAVAVTSASPLKRSLVSPGRRVMAAPAGGQMSTPTGVTFVSPEYFHILAIPVERGRPFTSAEAAAGAPVAIVSAATARAFWPNRDPIGQTIRIEPANGRPALDLPGYATVTVVGLAPDVASGMLTEGRDAGHIYLPVAAGHRYASSLLVKGRTAREAAAARLEELFTRVVADAQVFEAMPLDDLRAMQVYPVKLASTIGGILGTIALALSIGGLYGVLAYNVAQRRREIGIRLALGANASAVIRLVVRQSLRLGAIGAGVGLVVAFLAMRALNVTVNLATVSMLDPIAFGGGLLLVFAATLIAAFHPAQRAARIEPAITLRADA